MPFRVTPFMILSMLRRPAARASTPVGRTAGSLVMWMFIVGLSVPQAAVRFTRRCATIALIATSSLVPGGDVVAQGVVSGVLTIAERGAGRTPDLEDAVLWLEPIDGAGRAAAPVTVPIVMAERKYTPKVRLVSVGSTVEFPNQDPFRHNVFSKSGPSEFDLGLYDRGETRRARFAAAGVHAIFCNIHARMVAFVVATPTAWATQAGAGGRFRIADVPPGRYRLRAWHHRGGELTRELQVSAEGAADVAVALDARSYRFVQHRNKFGKPYPPDGTDRY
jgi:plastocyanin